MTNNEERELPLVAYVDGQRIAMGTATVNGNHITAELNTDVDISKMIGTVILSGDFFLLKQGRKVKK